MRHYADRPNPAPYDQLFPLRLALQNLIVPHRQIQILLQFSQSPQSRPALLCKMTVRAIPRLSSVQIALPTTPLCWQSLIEYVCGDNLIASYSWLDQQVTKLVSNSHYQHNVHGNVHGMCHHCVPRDVSPHLPTAIQLHRFLHAHLQCLSHVDPGFQFARWPPVSYPRYQRQLVFSLGYA